MPVAPELFRSALSRFASGVTVVTTKDAAGNPHGITVSAFCSVSLEPPMVLICIEKTTGSHYAFPESGRFVVNVLNAGQKHISERFALPFDDKFDGIAIRAPIPVGSIADLTFLTARPTSVDEVNRILTDEAATSRYAGVLGVSRDPLVSADIVGDPRASVIDLELTKVIDGDLLKIMSWYDNEWGYANQMVRQAVSMTAAR
jgi:hypothetical protein